MSAEKGCSAQGLHTNAGESRNAGAHWLRILLITGAGVVSAFQVGKLPMALMAVQADLGLSLSLASWLMSAFALIGAAGGAPIGLAVDRIGARRMAIGGLLLQSLGSACGGLSSGMAVLLASRVLEGLGFLCLIVAAPALITHTVPVRFHDRAMAAWASFMPVGMTLIMLTSPLLGLFSWRGIWFLNAIALAFYAALLGWRVAPLPGKHVLSGSIRHELAAVISAPLPWILGGLFAIFSFVFFALFGFLPSLMVERAGISLDAASRLTALAIAVSGVGSLLCGRILARGAGSAGLLLVSFGAMALFSLPALGAGVPALAAYAACLCFALASGLAPVVIFDSATRHAPRPAHVGVTLGFAMQGNNLGLLAGPVAASGLAAGFGWSAVSLLIVGACALGGLLVAVFQRLRCSRCARVAD